MSIYQPKPTYYRITWTLDSPTDYTGSGDTAGGLSPLTSIQYKNLVVVTGTIDGPGPMAGGESVLLNGYSIVFEAGDGIDEMIERFNSMTQYTGVMASNNWADYLTLQSMDPVDQPINIQNENGTPLAAIGIAPGVYTLSNPIYGGTFTTLTNGNSIILNGVTVTFVTGALDIAGACATINAGTSVHNVVATPWTDKIQLNTVDNSPIFFGNPLGSTATVDLGFANNTAYGGAMNLGEARIIERGALRWKGVMMTLETSLTAFVYDMNVLTGSTTDGNSPPTTVAWTLGVENIDHLYCITEDGEPETVGTVLHGPQAVKRLVARALTRTWSENRNVYNNTLTVRGTYALRENPIIVERITAEAIDTVADITAIEDNITVSMISYA